MKSESWIIVELEAAILLIVVLAFFRIPAYEKAVWFALGVIASAFTMVIGYKFGKSMPQQAGDPKPPVPGTQTESETRTSSKSETPVNPVQGAV